MTAPLPISGTDHTYTILNAAAVGTTLYIPIYAPGRVKLFQGVLGAALTTADETFTLAYAPPASTTYTNVTSGAFTIVTAASAAGNVGTTYVGPSSTAYVQDGGSFRITPSGGGGAAVPMVFNIVVGN